MRKTIYCLFLKKREKMQEFPVLPGRLGQYIFKNISEKAWREWLTKQTILINEKKLNLINKNDRKFLEKEMIFFLFKGKKIKIIKS